MHLDNNEVDNNETQAGSASSSYSKMRTFWTVVLLAPGAGLAASLISVMVMGILLLCVGAPPPVSLFGFFVLKHISVTTFLKLLLTFKSNAKVVPLALALVGFYIALLRRKSRS